MNNTTICHTIYGYTSVLLLLLLIKLDIPWDVGPPQGPYNSYIDTYLFWVPTDVLHINIWT